MLKHTSTHLVNNIHDMTQIPAIYCRQMLKVLGNALCKALDSEEEVIIEGLGRFVRQELRPGIAKLVFVPQPKLNQLLAQNGQSSPEHTEAS